MNNKIYCMINFVITEKDDVVKYNSNITTAIIGVDNIPEGCLLSEIAKSALNKLKNIYKDMEVNLIDYNVLGRDCKFINILD